MDRERFRKGFLFGLAAHGHTPEDLGRYAMTKQANPLATLGLVGGSAAASGPYKLIEGAADLGLASLLGLSAVGGLGAAGLAYSLTRNPSSKGVEDLQNEDLLNELKQQVSRVRRRLDRDKTRHLQLG